MRKFQLVQKQFNAPLNAVIEQNVIEETATYEAAVEYLQKRGFAYDEHREQWIKGNTFHFPVVIEQPKKGFDLADIGSFI